MDKHISKKKSIQPLSGGYERYIKTLDVILAYVEAEKPSTKEDLKSWYVQEFKTATSLVPGYINSLFRCGLLTKRGDHIKCAFPRSRDRDRKIIETIDDNVVFILDMLNEARDGASEDELSSLAKSEYGLSVGVRQIQWRRGWLQSAGLLEKKGRRLYATNAGRKLLQERHARSVGSRTSAPTVNRAEFGGEGEGMEHKTLKEYVCENCERILSKISGRQVEVISREMECELPSGDRVDVTARNEDIIWHIEVKSKISTESDIMRGLYQCVKYKAVEKVRQRVDHSSSTREVKSLLVVENELSQELKEQAKSVPVQCYTVASDSSAVLQLLGTRIKENRAAKGRPAGRLPARLRHPS